MCKKIANILLITISIILSVGCSSNNANKEISISVAASLIEPMRKICDIYEEANNIKVNINGGASGTLKNQIQEGAEVGLFFSADERYVDELINKNIAKEHNKINKIGNKLLLVKSKDSKETITTGKIAIGVTSTVPAGQYAKEALEALGIWEKIQHNIIFCKDVLAVKTYVEKGEVDFGFIYNSDAYNLEESVVVEEIPQELYRPINYSLISIDKYEYADECKKLIDLIISEEGLNIFKEYGFEIRE